jgi:hypothetical protein
MKRRDKGKKQRGVGVEDHPDHEKEEEIAENSTKEEWKGRKSERAEQNIMMRGMWLTQNFVLDDWSKMLSGVA